LLPEWEALRPSKDASAFSTQNSIAAQAARTKRKRARPRIVCKQPGKLACGIRRRALKAVAVAQRRSSGAKRAESWSTGVATTYIIRKASAKGNKMGYRTAQKDSATRNHMVVKRATMKKAKDDHLWQQNDIDMYYGESKQDLERAQNYGFTCVPLPQDKEEGQQSQGQGSGGTPGQFSNYQSKAKAAEALVIHAGSSSSHGVIIAIDDRRHRLKNMKEGEVALYE
jgi:hypothetical protein